MTITARGISHGRKKVSLNPAARKTTPQSAAIVRKARASLRRESLRRVARSSAVRGRGMAHYFSTSGWDIKDGKDIKDEETPASASFASLMSLSSLASVLSRCQALPKRPRVQHLARPLPFDALDVGEGDLGRGLAAGAVLAHGFQGLAHPGRADDVDPDTAWRLQRGGAGEAFQTGVDQADGSAPRHGVLCQDAAGQGERAAVADVGKAGAHQVHLPHELVREAELEIVVGELRQGLEPRLPRRRDEGVERPDGLEQPLDRALVRQVHLMVPAVMPDPHDLMAS